jgi:hypothetical protein
MQWTCGAKRVPFTLNMNFGTRENDDLKQSKSPQNFTQKLEAKYEKGKRFLI